MEEKFDPLRRNSNESIYLCAISIRIVGAIDTWKRTGTFKNGELFLFFASNMGINGREMKEGAWSGKG